MPVPHQPHWLQHEPAAHDRPPPDTPQSVNDNGDGVATVDGDRTGDADTPVLHTPYAVWQPEATSQCSVVVPHQPYCEQQPGLAHAPKPEPHCWALATEINTELSSTARETARSMAVDP